MSQVLDHLPGARPQDARPAEEPAIVAEHLARHFGPRAVLADVSFSVPPGTAFGIAGANGAGKSTLLRLVAGLDRPTHGRARILGQDTVRAARAVRQTIGYVPEEPLLYDGITAEQFLHFVGRARGLGSQLRAVTVDTLLQVVGLETHRRGDVSTLSPGQRRRLALASALVHEPRVLLLDDPLRGLDGYARLEQIEVLRELRRMENTLVLSATRPEDLLDVCDEMGVLRDGALAWRGSELDAARLAAPERGDALRVRVELLEGLEAALALLRQRRDVPELEVDDDGQTLWLLFAGDREALASLVPQLVRAGCAVAHFGVERRSPATAIANQFVASGVAGGGAA